MIGLAKSTSAIAHDYNKLEVCHDHVATTIFTTFHESRSIERSQRMLLQSFMPTFFSRNGNEWNDHENHRIMSHSASLLDCIVLYLSHLSPLLFILYGHEIVKVCIPHRKWYNYAISAHITQILAFSQANFTVISISFRKIYFYRSVFPNYFKRPSSLSFLSAHRKGLCFSP